MFTKEVSESYSELPDKQAGLLSFLLDFFPKRLSMCHVTNFPPYSQLFM